MRQVHVSLSNPTQLSKISKSASSESQSLYSVFVSSLFAVAPFMCVSGGGVGGGGVFDPGCVIVFLLKRGSTTLLTIYQPLKRQSRLQQTTNFATSLLIFENNKV